MIFKFLWIDKYCWSLNIKIWTREKLSDEKLDPENVGDSREIALMPKDGR